jgi:hypothetical protein
MLSKCANGRQFFEGAKYFWVVIPAVAVQQADFEKQTELTIARISNCIAKNKNRITHGNMRYNG